MSSTLAAKAGSLDRIVGPLERAQAMGLKAMGAPDALNGTQRNPDGLRHSPSGPMSDGAGRLGAGQGDDPRDDGLGDRRRPGLARFVAKQAVDSFLGKAPLPAPNRRATDAGAPRHFQHRQSVDGEQYDFRALHMLEGVVAIVDYPLEPFDVDGAREDANGLGHMPDSHVRPSL
jgi:hypothetical protein